MNEVELSRKIGSLHLTLKKSAMDELIAVINKTPNFESLQEPYKSWLVNPNNIERKYLTESAKKASAQ